MILRTTTTVLTYISPLIMYASTNHNPNSLYRGLFEETLRIFHEVLPEWQPATISREHFPSISTTTSSNSNNINNTSSITTTSHTQQQQEYQELSSFILNIQQNWAIDYIQEYQNCLD